MTHQRWARGSRQKAGEVSFGKQPRRRIAAETGEVQMKLIKTIGIASAMALALLAFAGAGLASANVFKSTVEPAVWSGAITGKSHTMELNGLFMSCPTSSFGGETKAKTTSSISTSPTLNCVNGSFTANWATNGCKWRFNAGGTMDIYGCEKPMSTTSWLCTAEIGNQSGLGPVTYKNTVVGGVPTITAVSNIKSITSTLKGTCPGGTGTFSNGAYSGEWTIKASTTTGIQAGAEVEFTLPPPSSFFSLEETPATLTASDTGTKLRINTPGMELSCESFTLNGTSSSTTPETLTLHPAYKNCTVGGVSVGNEWVGSACNYVLHPNGKMDITGTECTEGTLAYGRPGCNVQIRTQTGLPGVGYADQGWGRLRTVSISGTVTGVKYDEAGWNCPNEGTFTNGAIKMASKLSATNSGGGIQGISLE
jgi:hypothetical protein